MKRIEPHAAGVQLGPGHAAPGNKRPDHLLAIISCAIDQTADNVFITSRDGIIYYANPAFEQSTGYSKVENRR